MSITAAILLEKLLEIKRAIQCEDTTAMSMMLVEAEDCVLQMERELIAALRENERLRRAAYQLHSYVTYRRRTGFGKQRTRWIEIYAN
jgi:hypothetical protein